MKKLLLALTISGLALSTVPATAHAWSPYGDDAVMGHQPAPSYLKDLPADENPDVYTGYDFSQYDITHKPGAPKPEKPWSPYGDDAVMGHQPAPSYLKDLPADENPDIYTGYDFSQYDITHKPGAPKPEKQYADVAYGYYDDYGYWHYYTDAYGYPMYYHYGAYYYY